jgi:hypothetical protein
MHGATCIFWANLHVTPFSLKDDNGYLAYFADDASPPAVWYARMTGEAWDHQSRSYKIAQKRYQRMCGTRSSAGGTLQDARGANPLPNFRDNASQDADHNAHRKAYQPHAAFRRRARRTRLASAVPGGAAFVISLEACPGFIAKSLYTQSVRGVSRCKCCA